MLSTARCKEKDCGKYPSFHYADKVSGIYCKTHKLPDMINVKAKRKYCTFLDCNICATYNFPDTKKGIYCKSHCIDGMIDVINKRCMFLNCNVHPSYNTPGIKTGIYCLAHKDIGMIDVVSKLCKEPNCIYQPRFNYRGQKRGLYCSKHKLTEMINIIDHTCTNIECDKLASFNYINNKLPIFCAKHRKPDMVNIIQKTCKTPLCDTQVRDKYDGYCLRCFMYQFPDKPVSRNYKTKEKCVIDYLNIEFADHTLICDKRVIGGDSYKRPDILLDLSSHNIIIEIDENQHNTYDCSCENKRIMQLSSDLKHKPIVFIRFNPDKYIDASNNLVESCWKIDGNGISCIKNEIEWSNRLLSLKQQLTYWINNPTGKMIEIVQLYYDQN